MGGAKTHIVANARLAAVIAKLILRGLRNVDSTAELSNFIQLIIATAGREEGQIGRGGRVVGGGAPSSH